MRGGKDKKRNRWPPEGLSWSSGSPSKTAPGILACREVNIPQWCLLRVASPGSLWPGPASCGVEAAVHRELILPTFPSGFGDPALSQHLPWVAEVTRTVVTQRLQSAAAKRAMAKARGGHGDLSGLWGGPRPASPGYHGLAHQPGGGQRNDTGQELTSASTEGICLLSMVRPFLGLLHPGGAHCPVPGHSHQFWTNGTSLGAI